MPIVDIIIKTIDQGSSSATKNVSGSLDGLAKSLLGPIAGYASLAGVIGLAVTAGKLAINSAAEQQTADVKLAATVKSMGMEHQISATKIGEMAAALMLSSTASDEAYQAASQYFLQIEGFNPNKLTDTLSTMADFAAGTGQTVDAASQQLSNALITGQGRALHFSAAQREMFQEMVKSGDQSGALAMAMDVLNQRYGGQALAQLNTYKGSTEHLKNTFGEFWEAVGKGLTGPGQKFNEWIDKNVQAVTKSVDAQNDQAKAVDVAIKAIYGERNALTSNSVAWILHAKQLDLVKYAYLDALGTADTELEKWTGKQADIEVLTARLAAHKKALEDVSAQQSFVSQVAADYMEYEKQTAEVEAQLFAARKAGYSETGEKITGLKTTLQELAAEQEKQLNQFILNSVAQELAVDGWTKAEFNKYLALGNMYGIYSASAIKAAQDAWAVRDAILGITDKTVTITVNTITTGQSQAQGWMDNNPSPSPSAGDYTYIGTVNGPGTNVVFRGPGGNNVQRPPNYGTTWHGQNGLDFIVPPGFSNDSFPVRAQSGEHVKVTPAGKSPANGPVDISPKSLRALAAIIQQGAM
jgi:hypothetical protein